MDNFWKETTVARKINKKKLMITILVLILLIAMIVTAIIYIKNEEVREWIDINILQKEKSQNNLPSIEIEEINYSNIIAFNKYIGVLDKNILQIYNSTGKKENELNIEISTPIFNSNNRYLVVGEEKGKKIYLIEDKEILWEKNINGNISKIEVNKNGYVAIAIVDTNYKTVVTMYNNQGDELFNLYLSTTRVSGISISEDNKNLALAEVDTSGTLVESKIKIVSIDKVKSDAENSIEKVYDANKNELIINIKYQEKNRLVCMYTNKITVIKQNEEEKDIQNYVNNNKVSFASIDLNDATITVEEKSSGIFTADSVLNIRNSNNKGEYNYSTDSVTKEIFTKGNIIALNLGSKVEFINTNGWLLKRYKAEQEITGIVLSNSIAGIVYRDKIEVINL